MASALRGMEVLLWYRNCVLPCRIGSDSHSPRAVRLGAIKALVTSLVRSAGGEIEPARRPAPNVP